MAKNVGDLIKRTSARAWVLRPRPTGSGNPFVLPVLSSVWMLLACFWLIVEPRISLRIPVLEIALAWIPIGISIALIGLVAIDAFARLFRHGQHQMLFGDVLFLLMLFTIVFMQLSTHADALHFAHEFAATPLDWLLFSFGNALRAADLADALKDYGVYVPQITPNSWFACSLLIAYRLIIDILFLSYALLTVKRVGEWITKAIAEFLNSVIEIHMIYLLCCVIFAVCWAVTVHWWSPWLVRDQILWPLDNFVRVIDIFDAMQIFGIRLDSVPNGPWEITLGVVLRILIAIALATPISKLQERLEKHVRTEILQVKSGKPVALDEKTHAEASTGLRLAVCAIVVFVAGMVATAKLSESTHRRLVQTAVSEHDEHSHKIIRRLGINCSTHTMHALHEVAVDHSHDEEKRLQATETLAYFGSMSVDLLIDSLRSNPTLATKIVDSLVRVGPSSSSGMVSLMGEDDKAMRRRALDQLTQWGGEAVSYLAPQVEADNAIYYYTLFDQIDPYWDRRRGSGNWYKQLVNAKRSYRWLEPDIRELFNKTSLSKSRSLADSVQSTTMRMKWSPPSVAEELIRVEAYMHSANYQRIRKDWVQKDIRQHGRTGYYGTGAQYESDGIGDVKDHLVGVIKRHPETAIDVFLKHQASGERLYEDAALECMKDILGPDFEQAVRKHRRRGIQQRVFFIDAEPPGPDWSPPDVRQILIDSGLTEDARTKIPICSRGELAGDEARDTMRMMADRPDEVWIDVLRELKRVAYPSEFFQPIAIAALAHPSPPIRLKACEFYPDVSVGAELIGEHLSQETEPEIVAAILRAANASKDLSQAVGPSLDSYSETESQEIADAVAQLLSNDFLRRWKDLGTLATQNPLYRAQLLDRIESVPDLRAVEEAYVEILNREPPEEEQIAKLLGALDGAPSSTQLRLLQELAKHPEDRTRRTAITRMLGLDEEGTAAFFAELEKQSDPAMIRFCFGELRQWLQAAHPELFAAEQASETAATSQIRRQVFSTVAMSTLPVRRSGLTLLGQFDAPHRQAILTDLYKRLEMESDVELRRQMIEFFLAAPPEGIKGVYAWHSRETDSNLIRFLDNVIARHKEAELRMQKEKELQQEADLQRIGELVAASREATHEDVDSIEEELIGLGDLSVQPMARMLYEPELENRYAIEIGFKVLESAGAGALPILEVLAKGGNEKVWRKAVDAIADSGPLGEPHLRSLLKVPRPLVRTTVLRKLSRSEGLQDQTLIDVARLLMVEESGIDNLAYSVLIKHHASQDLLERASRSPRVRESLRSAIRRRLEKSATKSEEGE